MSRFYKRTLGWATLAGALLLCLGTTPLLSADEPHQSDKAALTVRVVGARNAKGTIGALLFKSVDGFPGNPKRAIREAEAHVDTTALGAELVFQDLPDGVYAVSVRHDENGNGKFDKNILGIPKEGYGVSNNPKKMRRAPTFEEAKFTLAGATTIEIRLIY